MSFESLKVAELRRAADEDFAVEVGEKASKPEVLAALVESGVTWDMYLAQHPEAAPDAEEPVQDNGVITSTSMAAPALATKVVVREELPLFGKEEWLVKMVRANPLYEVRGHRFTQENPFALVNPADAEYLLTREEGFRQATPSELQEYYG